MKLLEHSLVHVRGFQFANHSGSCITTGTACASDPRSRPVKSVAYTR